MTTLKGSLQLPAAPCTKMLKLWVLAVTTIAAALSPAAFATPTLSCPISTTVSIDQRTRVPAASTCNVVTGGNVSVNSPNGALAIAGTLNLYGTGRLVNHNRLRNASGGTFATWYTSSQYAQFVNYRVFRNAGLYVNRGQTRNYGTIINQRNGVIDVLPYPNVGEIFSYEGASIINRGTVIADGFIDGSIGSTFTNYGNVIIHQRIQAESTYLQKSGTTTADGRLVAQSLTIKSGALYGTGEVLSNDMVVGAHATVSPGDGPGAIGTLRFTGVGVKMLGTLGIDIAGTGVGNYDFLNDEFDMAFGDTSRVHFFLGSDTNQQAGDSFHFLRALDFLNFADIRFQTTGLAAGLDYRVFQSPGPNGRSDLVMQLFERPVPAPEPGSFGIMLLGGLLVTVSAAHRRRHSQ